MIEEVNSNIGEKRSNPIDSNLNTIFDKKNVLEREKPYYESSINTETNITKIKRKNKCCKKTKKFIEWLKGSNRRKMKNSEIIIIPFSIFMVQFILYSFLFCMDLYLI